MKRERPRAPESSPEQDQKIIRILIADRSTLFRAAVAALVASEPDLRVVCEASNESGLAALVKTHTADIVLLDPGSSPEDGMAVLSELRASGYLNRTILLTDCEEPALLVRGLDLGVRGVVLKRSSTTQLMGAIRAALQGRLWVDEAFLKSAWARIGGNRLRVPSWWRWTRLSERQKQIVTLILQGRSNREIARRLMLRIGTVNSQLHHAYLKLAISSRRDLALYERYGGLPQPQAPSPDRSGSGKAA